MADLMEQGAAFLAEQQKLHASKPVLYSRTGTGSGTVIVSAMIGRTEWEQTDDLGTVLRTESRDFIIKAKDLVLSGVVVTPKDDDEIREDIGQQVFVYQVMAPGAEPPWRHADFHRHQLRIHTKHVRTE